ncbi:Potassium/sodium hyperpolarization-activated cyclic nucleotide-gated channel 4 [Papilio machaon]|uniref:Potassium/sodium hyperpolarization-activated cyclic nucleotide-gated channel 4 n=1 Tax=Papilio machaon TaxID=76193 RepID=A0A0N0PCM6_PAPMA|nr:Potassium/sodium hyperpolarization-activated cyclic nucleotide-gated channel 4 [Papilio machaon]
MVTLATPQTNIEHLLECSSVRVQHYLRGWFVVDFVSCLPLAYVLLHTELIGYRYLLLGHLMATLRVLRIATVVRNLKPFMLLFTESYIWHRTVRHTLLFLISVHWTNCIIYILPALGYYWTGKMPRQYTLFLNSTSGDLSSYSPGVRYNKALFITLSALAYMQHKQLPAQLKIRLREFYRYRYQEQYYKEDDTLECLSDQLRHEIILHTCYKLVNRLPLLEGLPASVVGAVMGCLKPEVYLPNDLVMRAGDNGDCMYFIANGTVAVYSLKGVEICHLEDGDHFGEVALLMADSKRVATVVSVEITQVYRLDAVNFRYYSHSNLDNESEGTEHCRSLDQTVD